MFDRAEIAIILAVFDLLTDEGEDENEYPGQIKLPTRFRKSHAEKSSPN